MSSGCGCLGTNPVLQRGSVWPLGMERILCLQSGLHAVEVLQEQLFVRAPERQEILLERLLCIKTRGISEIFLLPAVTTLYLCPGCAGPAFTQLRLHTDFLVLSQNYLSAGLCPSQTQVLMFLQLSPALNLSPVQSLSVYLISAAA